MKNSGLQKVIIVGDKVLIKPKSFETKTKGGLILPPNIKEKEKVHAGYIMRVGPGYPIPPYYEDDSEPWKDPDEVDYIPLQANEGDLAIYLQKDAIEINYEGENYVIVPHNAIMMLIREDDVL